MKSIRKNLVAVVAGIILSSGMLIAQQGPRGNNARPNGDPEARQQRMLDRMAYELTLTEEQKEKLKTIYAEHFGEVEKLWEDQQKVFEERQEKRDELRAQLVEDVKKELSDEQKIKYDEMLERMEARRQNGRRGNGNSRPGAGPRQRPIQ